MNQKLLIVVVLMAGLMSCKKPLDNFYVKSPDKNIDLRISLVDNKLTYQAEWSGQEVVGGSDLEIFSDATISILSAEVNQQDEEWSPVWGQFSSIRNKYNELELEIESNEVKGKLLARVYDEGVAFRFVLAEGAKPEEATYRCTYSLPDGSNYFVPAGESEPMGPVSLAALDEGLRVKKNPGTGRKYNPPVVIETPNHQFLALLESDLYAAEGFSAMQFDVDLEQKKIVTSTSVELSQQELISPWRAILIGNSAGDLVVNTMLENLATACMLENTDWIKPGMTLWDWRVHGYTAPDGFTYGTNTESYLRFIDFASAYGIEYFLIDASWFTAAGKGTFEISEELDLPKVSSYAQAKDVGLILYYDRHKGDYGDEELFPYYHSLGMKGIKYGFMGNNVDFTRDAIRMSAESELLIDFHDGPVPFSGIHRTYPNAVTREYCHAQQDSRRAFTPESFIKMAHINAITGPLDMNNGNFDITGINRGDRMKGPIILNSYPSTVVSEAARTLVIFSGLVCIPDAPEAYEAKKDLFEFIQNQPVGKWDESRVINSNIEKYITTARRHGQEWFIGSVIDQQGGTLDIKLDFLEEGLEYEAAFYEDAEDTHCKTNPEAYKVRKSTVKKGDLIKAKLAPGGGHCMWIRPKL